MRRRLLIVVVAVLLAVALLVPLAAQAGGLWRSSGDFAEAYFAKDNGDVHSYIYFWASDTKSSSPPGNGSVYSYVYVGAGAYQDGVGTLMDAWGWVDLAPRDFVLAGGLKSAKLAATVPMWDWATDSGFDLKMVVDWKGVGKVSKNRYSYHYSTPYFKFSESGSGSWSQATAKGTFSIDGAPVPMGSSVYGSLSQSKNHSVQID